MQQEMARHWSHTIILQYMLLLLKYNLEVRSPVYYLAKMPTKWEAVFFIFHFNKHVVGFFIDVHDNTHC